MSDSACNHRSMVENLKTYNEHKKSKYNPILPTLLGPRRKVVSVIGINKGGEAKLEKCVAKEIRAGRRKI